MANGLSSAAAPVAGSGGLITQVAQVPYMPQPTFLNIEADFLQAYDTTDFAVQHASIADSFVTKLEQLAGALVPPTINPNFPAPLAPPTLTTTQIPDLLPISYTVPAAPIPFNGVLGTLPGFPTFDVQPPALLFPNAPIEPYLSVPQQPAIDTNFTYPTFNGLSLPPAPQLISINVQPFDGVTFPVFDADAPVLTLAAPQIVNYLPNAPYTDALLSGLMGTLESRLSIGVTGTNTGLPTAVEQNIWNRGREREYEQLGDSIANLDKMEGMGYALPSGAFIDARIKLETEFAAKSYGFSREVMIKQAELEQSNIQKAMEIAAQIEDKLIDYANQTEQRRFDACRYATEAGVSIYNAGVQAYSARIAGYKAQVDVYTAQIAGARGIIEAYQAEIEAEKTKVDANTAIIQQYDTGIKAALASIQVFQAEIDLVKTQAEIEQLKVSIFGEQVKAYAAEINVYSAEVEAYKAIISAEDAKQAAYKTQADVYSSLVQATSAQINATIDSFKAQLEEKTQEYQAFSALVSAEAENVKAIAEANTSIAEVYKAEVMGASSYNEALVKEWESINTVAVQIAQVGISAAQAQGQLYLTTQQIISDAAKIGAQVEAQIAASALGTVTFQTHRSRQDSVSSGQSVSFGQSQSRSDQSSTADNTQTTYYNDVLPHINNNTQQSVSTSTAYNHNIQSVE